MSTNCKASCGQCQGQEATTTTTTTTTMTTRTTPNPTGCSDKEPRCESWKDSGYCVGTFAPYMSTNCKASCGQCQGQENDPKCGPEETVVFGRGGKFCTKKFLPNLECDSNAEDQAAECAKQCKKNGDFGGKKCDHLTKCDSGLCNDQKKCDGPEDCEGLGHGTSGWVKRYCIDKGDGKRCHASYHDGFVAIAIE